MSKLCQNCKDQDLMKKPILISLKRKRSKYSNSCLYNVKLKVPEFDEPLLIEEDGPNIIINSKNEWDCSKVDVRKILGLKNEQN
jgi:hypothetical protein